jgi:hypothetical protein
MKSPTSREITACMVKQRANLSPGCRAVMDREHAARRRAATAEWTGRLRSKRMQNRLSRMMGNAGAVFLLDAFATPAQRSI